MSTEEALHEQSVRAGMKMARRLFEGRSGHGGAPVSSRVLDEAHLAAALTVAFRLGFDAGLAERAEGGVMECQNCELIEAAAERERLLEALGDGWVVQRAGSMFEAVRAPEVVGGDTERLSENSLARLLLSVHLRIRERNGGPCIAMEALRDDD